MDCPQELQPDGTYKCPQCGWTYHKLVRRNCPKAPSRGLGDTIAKLTRKIGITPCRGCRDRQKKLNELIPYKRSE